MRCEWAGCELPATTRAGRWSTCQAHHDEHLALAWEKSSHMGRPRTVQHGTPSGYRRHQRDRIPACEPCLAAWRDRATAKRRARGVQPRNLRRAS